MLPSATDLTYFLKVAIELHISRAARRLNVTQPSLSLAIKRLENIIGSRLFIRHKQRLTLTRAGEELHKEAKALLSQWEKTILNIKNINHNIHGRVTIGCHSTLSPFMSNMVAKLLNHYPALEIHFHHELTENIMENIIKGHIDIGLVTDPYPHPDVILQPLTQTEFTFWISKNHSTIDLFAKDTVIICDTKLRPTQYLLKKLAKKTTHHHFKLNTMSQIETMAAMTVEGYGIGILPSSFTKKYFGEKLKPIPNAPIYKKPLFLTYRPENKDVKVIKVVLAEIRDLVDAKKAT